MKKNIFASILCIILLVSSVPLAQSENTNLAFADFTLSLGKVSYSGGKLSVRLIATFQSEETAKQYEEFVPDRNATLMELDEFYRSFVQGILDHKARQLTTLRAESETRAEAFDKSIPDHFMLLMATFNTVDGGPFFPEGSYESWEFGSHSEPKKQADGTWRHEITLTANGFRTDEETLVMPIYIFDPQGSAPYTGVPQHTLHIPLPNR